jgi:membrane protein implicated in regulation of membrane protease activity
MHKSGIANAPGRDLPAELKAGIASWLVTATLSLILGLVVLGSFAAVAALAAGSLGVAHSACEQTEAALASDLGISVATLRATDPASIVDQIAARQTTSDTRQATDRAATYANCRQVFAPPLSAPPGDR